MVSQFENTRLTRRNVLLGLLFLVGLCIFVYPFANNWYYQNVANGVISDYEAAIDPAKQAEYDAAFQAAQKANQVLVGQTVPDVFAIREGTSDADYEATLNVLGNGMMGVVDIPAIDVHLPIYHYSTEESLLKGCGHIFGSSLPVGGDSSHAVITAHRGLPQAKMFSDLDQVRKGDRFFLKVLDRTLAYEVDQIEVVAPQETRSLAIERGKDYVTLVTCTPYGVNTDRLLVRGHRVPYVDGDENAATDPRLFGLLTKVAVAGIGVLLALVLLWVVGRVRRARAGAGAAGAAGAAGEVLDAEVLPLGQDDADGAGPGPGDGAHEGKIARARHRA